MDKINFKNHPSFEMFKNSTGRMLKKAKIGTKSVKVPNIFRSSNMIK